MKTDVETFVAEFRSANESVAGCTQAILSSLVGDSLQHARLMNTLSMLEHMGSHKIAVTQHAISIDQPTLKHLAEEARHAYFFKRLAEREAGHPLGGDPAEMLAPFAARRYFQRLEIEIVRSTSSCSDRRATYLVMSLVVEFRAIWFYKIYQSVLTSAGHNVSLRSLVAEEEGHLADMSDRLRAIGQCTDGYIYKLWPTERAHYKRLLFDLGRTECPSVQDHSVDRLS